MESLVVDKNNKNNNRYMGAFDERYRQKCIKSWKDLLTSKKIAVTEDYSLRFVLGSDVRVRSWTIARLPNDKFSIDNAIIMNSSKRWPLMIDPQGQANRWIRNMYGEKKKKKKEDDEDEDEEEDEEDEEEKSQQAQQKPLKVCKQNESSFGRTLENCITYVVFEHVVFERENITFLIYLLAIISVERFHLF